MEPDVDRLLADLRSWSPRRRRAAAEALGSTREKRAVEPLCAALGDLSSGVRVAVAEALGKLGDAHAIGPLVHAIASERRGLIVRLHPATVDALRALCVGHEDALVRAVLAEMRFGSTDVLGLVVAPTVQGALCREILGVLAERGPVAVMALFRVVDLRDPGELRAAGDLLRQLDAPAVADAVLQALLRGDAQETRVVQVLVWGEITRRLRVSAEWIRAGRGAAEELAVLLESHETWAAAWAAEVLGMAGCEEIRPRLRWMLQCPDTAHHLPGAVGLAYLGDPDAVAPLVRALADAESRYYATDALAHLGALAAGALPALRALRAAEGIRVIASHYSEAIRRIEAALRSVPAELEAAAAPAGTGTEPEATSAPKGRGTEPVSGAAEGA